MSVEQPSDHRGGMVPRLDAAQATATPGEHRTHLDQGSPLVGRGQTPEAFTAAESSGTMIAMSPQGVERIPEHRHDLDQSDGSQEAALRAVVGGVVAGRAHPGIERASALLAQVASSGLEFDATLSAADVIDDLANVQPPLPPLDLPTSVPGDLAQMEALIDQAMAELTGVVETTTDSGEAMRAALGVRELRAMLARRADPAFAASRRPVSS